MVRAQDEWVVKKIPGSGVVCGMVRYGATAVLRSALVLKGALQYFKFIHYLVHHRKGFHSVKITFRIRGHSYMECDKNFGLVNLKTKMETPSEWYSLLKT
jgi:hypothetical protein